MSTLHKVYTEYLSTKECKGDNSYPSDWDLNLVMVEMKDVKRDPTIRLQIHALLPSQFTIYRHFTDSTCVKPSLLCMPYIVPIALLYNQFTMRTTHTMHDMR